MYKGVETEGRVTRTLEICEGTSENYYFTVYEGRVLLYSSPHNTDRVAVTVKGIQYLDNLNLVDYRLREQEKGNSDGC